MGMIGSVGMVLHPQRNCSDAMATICDWARDHHVAVLGLAGDATRTGHALREVTPEDLPRESDLLVSLGGDGTMLRAMRMSTSAQTPVLGVNLGRLGFLAEVDIPELPEALSAIDTHRFTTEPRSGLRGTTTGWEALSFNDIALERIPGHGMTAVQLHVEGHPFVRYRADAVVVATPTGSTAYSFSAGGPIVSPSAEGLLVTPVAPHSAFNRAVFLSAGEKLVLEVMADSGEVAVEADGGLIGNLTPGSTVELTVLPSAARVVRLGRTTFYQRTQRRLRLDGAVVPEAPPAPYC
jgi:NAD+ kinase